MAHKTPGKAEECKTGWGGNTDFQLWVQNSQEGIVLPDIEIYYNTTVIKPGWYNIKKSLGDQRSRIVSPKGFQYIWPLNKLK